MKDFRLRKRRVDRIQIENGETFFALSKLECGTSGFSDTDDHALSSILAHEAIHFEVSERPLAVWRAGQRIVSVLTPASSQAAC